MDRSELDFVVRRLDSDNNKREILAAFLRTYDEMASKDELTIENLKFEIIGLSDRFIRKDLRRGKNELKTVKDYVLIEKFFWMVNYLNVSKLHTDYLKLDRYVKIVNCLDEHGKLGIVLDYVNRGKYRFSEQEADLLDRDFSSIPNGKWTVDSEMRSIADVANSLMNKLSDVYRTIIERPKEIAAAKEKTAEYAAVAAELMVNQFNGTPLYNYGYEEVSKYLSNPKSVYNKIFTTLYSPESIFVLFNNYRIAPDMVQKDQAKKLLLKAAYYQSKFYFNRSIVFEPEMGTDEHIKALQDFLDDWVKMLNKLGAKIVKAPTMPFYSRLFFEARVDRDSDFDAGLLSFVDRLNDLQGMEYTADQLYFDIFADEVIASAEFNMREDREPYNTEYDVDVLFAIAQSIKEPYTGRVKDYVNEFYKRRHNRISYIKKANLFYLTGIYLRTIYHLSDAIVENGNSHPFRFYRDEIQGMLYSKSGYGKASGLFEKYDLKGLDIREERLYSALKTEIIVSVENALSSVKSLDEIMTINIKSCYSRYLLCMGNDDYFLSVVDGISERIIDLVEAYVRVSPNFSAELGRIENNLRDKLDDIKSRLNTYLAENRNIPSGAIEANINRVKRCLATGEYLYQQYVCNDENLNIDYSCIALEYYRALELLVNTVFYYPYLENVLKERYRVMANSNRPSTYFYGYLGGTDWQHITRRGGFKESLELGTISRMYKAMFNGNSVRPEFSQLNQYLIDISINAMDVSRIFGEVIRISVLRNEAAHGGEVLPKERAMKAQDVTYIHIPSPDPTIDTDSLSAAATCVNMIMEILNLF